ncbi:MAG TPA: NEW3 domain-containing protein, partial [Lacipirellulaceae bacterium]|nr:NEW3 domain-containing protein [Lacipirellulaceae bacterium]
SLARLPQPESTVAALRDKLFRFGQDVNVGLGWKGLQASTGSAKPPWEVQQYAASPALTGDELAEYLALPARKNVQRWVMVEPLSRREYDLETRARDLVEQMLAAKIHGADAIFAARPFDDDSGLMTEEGMPGELFLPWRTTASLLSGARFLGSVELPRHSHNRLFETGDGQVLMVVWSDAPAEEVIHLGDQLRVLDVWGRNQPPRRLDDRYVIDVDAMPLFVTGLNGAVARWGMHVQIASRYVPSVFGKAHANRIEIRNTFAQGIGGVVKLVAPKGWTVAPPQIDFKLAAGETVIKAFDVSLPFDAASGPAPIRADFVIEADRQYRFSVNRELVVGDGQVEIETTTRIEEDGSLIVEQRMINHGADLADFKCLLFAPGRRRQRIQVFRLGASPDAKAYRYPDGAQLLGATLLLRAEEVNGSRVLNHRFVVEQ